MLRLLKGYIRLMANRHKWRSVLLSVEDVVQEGTVVLWKILVKYRKATPEELTKLFMVSFRRHLVAICKKEGIKNDRYVTSLQALESAYNEKSEATSGFPTYGRGELAGIRLRDGGKPHGVTLLPWDFYAMKLRELSRRIGKKTVHSFIHEGRRANTIHFERRKEEVLKAFHA